MRFILKRVIYLLLLIGVLSVPVLMFNSQWRDSIMRAGSDLFRQARQVPRRLVSDGEDGNDAQPPLSPLAIQLEQAMQRFHAEGGRISDFNRIFQCGAPRSWVQRTHVDASRTRDGQRDGLRVTLVTGEELEDLAGSLTYWFDRQGRVERISFQGVTGNPAKLVSFARRSQKMVARGCERDALFVRDGKNGPLHLLHISRSPVVNVKTQYGRYHVTLELNRPGSSLSLASSEVLEGG
jgi:hypothetical protein